MPGGSVLVNAAIMTSIKWKIMRWEVIWCRISARTVVFLRALTVEPPSGPACYSRITAGPC